MSYTIKYNRTSIHIAGLEIRTNGSGIVKGDYVTYYAQNPCGALTRTGYKMAESGTSDDVAEILKMARGKSIAIGNQLCKKCEDAAQAMIKGHEQQ